MVFYFFPFEFSPFSRGRLIPARVTLNNSDSSFVHTCGKEGARPLGQDVFELELPCPLSQPSLVAVYVTARCGSRRV